MSLACCDSHTPLLAGKGTGLLREKGFYGTTQTALHTPLPVWGDAVHWYLNHAWGNLMGRGWLEGLVPHSKGGKVGKRLHSQTVLGQRVTERSPRNRMWVIRERQAGFIGSISE